MNKTELVKKSIYIIDEYYKNNLQPYFDAIADDVLWFGPRAGHVLRGKAHIEKAWETERHDLRFSMGNIEAAAAAVGIGALEVMLEYDVYTYFPGEKTDRHHQRLHLSWGNRKNPQIYMIHISNISDKKSDTIYAATSEDSALDAAAIPPSRSITIYAQGKKGLSYYFNSLSIFYIESTNESRHSIVHAVDGTYTTIVPLRYYEKQFGNIFLRAHSSYLINPLYVRSLQRFHLLMTTGDKIPVPEKKYTAFRRQLEEYVEEYNRQVSSGTVLFDTPH